jgi:hypothetical protein
MAGGTVGEMAAARTQACNSPPALDAIPVKWKMLSPKMQS